MRHLYEPKTVLVANIYLKDGISMADIAFSNGDVENVNWDNPSEKARCVKQFTPWTYVCDNRPIRR